MTITIDKNVAAKFKCAVLFFTEIENSETNESLWHVIEAFSLQLRKAYDTPSQAADLFETSRKLYRAIGIDPTRRRPSSEALLRRVIQRKPLYKVNTLVDAGNYCSMYFHLSIGFYDAHKIKGNVTFRLGLDGEHYQGINKGVINVAGRLALIDDVGPFGNPSSDSDRTKLTRATREAMMVLFAPADYQDSLLAENADFAQRTILQYCNGKLTEPSFLPLPRSGNQPH